MPESETKGKEGAAKSGVKKTTSQKPGKGKAGKGKGEALAQPISGDQVSAYLRRHPEFLADNPELLDAQQPPSRVREKGVVDLQQFQVQRLRDEVGSLTSLRDELISAGRSNLSTQSRVHQAVLVILNARSFEEFVEIITTDMAAILDLDVVTIGVEKAEQGATWQPTAGVYCLETGSIDALLGPGGTMLLRENVTGDPTVFDGGAGLVQSDALIRLNISDSTPPALLALGSRQPDAFHDGQGTELLVFLSQVLEVTFRAWLNLPPKT
ncbi:DUF484 family protein [Pelagibius sp.]|uniref:DUF484 family protein n=1 Tax=Pelagibius sp. TaxID=1931238 RepID=UPI003BAF38C4